MTFTDLIILFAVFVAIIGLIYAAMWWSTTENSDMTPKELKALFDHHFVGEFRDIRHRLDRILCSQEKIMAGQADLQKQLNDVSDKLTKVGTEIDGLSATSAESLAIIKQLQDQILNNPVDPATQALVDKVAAKAQELDDKIPDAPTP